MQTYNVIDQALKDRAPKFRAELQAQGELTAFVKELDLQVRTEIGRAGTDKATQALPYLQKVQRMNALQAAAREIAMSEALESLPDETSPPRAD
jgi:hypothetical protein